MKFTITASKLADVVGRVKGIVPSRTTIPVLNNVLIDAGTGVLAVTATNTAIEATSWEACETVDPGRITVPGAVLYGLAKGLPKSKDVDVYVKGDRLMMECGRSKYDLRTLPVEDMPSMSVSSDAASMNVSAADFKSCLDATRQTVSAAQTDLSLTGVHITNEDGRMAFVSSDRFRLVRVYGQDINAHLSAVVPSDAVREIVAMLAECTGDATVTISGRHIRVATDRTILTARLIEDKYLDYVKPVQSAGGDGRVSVEAGELAEALARLIVVYSQAGVDVKAPVARCRSNGGTLDISAGGKNGTDIGEESIDADIDGPIEFGVSAQSMAQLVGMWPATATLDIRSSPGNFIKITSNDVPHQTQIVSPMRG